MVFLYIYTVGHTKDVTLAFVHNPYLRRKLTDFNNFLSQAHSVKKNWQLVVTKYPTRP